MANTGFINPVSAFSISAARAGNPNRPWTVGLGAPGTLMSGARVSDNIKVKSDDMSAAAIPFPFFAQFDITAHASAQGFNVQGFTVRYERNRNSTALSANETWIQFTSGASTGLQFLGATANSNTGNWSTTDTYVTAGGSGDMLGMTTADASAGRFKGGHFGFAVNIRYGAGTTLTSAIASIDHMQLQVHYSRLVMDVQTAEWGHEHSNVGPLVQNLVPNASEFGYEIFDSPVTAVTDWAQPGKTFQVTGGLAGAADNWFNLDKVSALDLALASAAGANPPPPTLYLYDFGFGVVIPDFATVLAPELEIVYTHRFADIAWSTIPTLAGVMVSASATNVSSQTQYGLTARTSGGVSAGAFGTAAGTFATAVSGSTIRPFSTQEIRASAFGVRYSFGTASSSTSPPSDVLIDLLRVRVNFLGYTSAKAVEIEQEGGGQAEFEVFSAEFDYEAQSLAFSKNIVAQSSEYDHEVSNAALSFNLAANSAEFDYEVQSAELVSFFVQSAEFDWEVRSVALSNNLIVQSGEWDHEIQSADLTWVIIPQSSEYEWEADSPALQEVAGGTDVTVSAAEFDWEAQSLAFTVNFVVQSAEFDHEIQSASIGALIVAQSGEWDWEAGSADLTWNLVAQSAEFDWEARSVALTQAHNLLVTPAEFDWEVQSASITTPVLVTTGEWDWEAQSVALARNLVAQSSEYDHEISSVDTEKNLVVQSAEFDFESGSPAIAYGAMLINGFERGWEVSDVRLTKNQRITSSEYGYEVGSVGISNTLQPGGAEFDWEARSVALSFNTVVAENEYEWEAESLDLHQFYDVSAGAIGATEFDFEIGSPTIRFFLLHPGTPPDRIKYARTGVLN